MWTSEFHFATHFLFLPGEKKEVSGPPSEAEGTQIIRGF